MRNIKFRGKRIDNGKYVFGDLLHMTGGHVGIIFDKRVAAVEVDPDSVAQFLYRYPSSNEEYYSGDQVGFSPDGRPLSIQNAIVLVDNLGKSFFFDERFFQHSNNVFPPWAIESTDLLKLKKENRNETQYQNQRTSQGN